MAIYDLSEREVYQLKSIEPHLSEGWQDILFAILPRMDKEGQEAISQRILTPRNIYYDREAQQFKYTRAKTLQEITEHQTINHPICLELVAEMKALLSPAEKKVNVYQFATKLERILGSYNAIDLSNENIKLKQELRNSFLYDVADWIDNTELVVKEGVRKLTEDSVKTYLKEVYLKQQIQGWDFRSWDAFEVQKIEDIPDWIKLGAKKHQYSVVETPHYWFLIGKIPSITESPYALSRFLLEVHDTLNKSININHLAIAKDKIDDPEFKKRYQYCISRIETLSSNVSRDIKGFVQESKKHQIQYMQPILSTSIDANEEDIEQLACKRLMNYEKQLTILILVKLPRVIELANNKKKDQIFLFSYLTSIIKQLTDYVENFRLQPIVSSLKYAEDTYLRLTSYNLLLHKFYDIIVHPTLTEKQKTRQITEPLILLDKKLEQVDKRLEELDGYVDELTEYAQNQHNEGLLGRIFSGNAPDYTMEDIQNESQQVHEQLFVYVNHLVKNKHDIIISPEYEFYQQVDETHRHYAFADGKLGVERLPKLIRLPEDTTQFNVDELRQALSFDVFKAVFK